MEIKSEHQTSHLGFEQAKQWFLDGIDALEHARYEKAEICFKESLAKAPGRISSLINLVAALVKQKKFCEARQYADAALLIEPMALEVHLSLSEIMIGEGDDVGGLQKLTQILIWHPECWIALCNRGGLHLKCRRYDLASKDLKRLIDAGQHLAEAYNLRGILNQALKLWPAAIADYQQALAIRPTYPEAMFNLGLAYAEARQFQNSIAVLEKSQSMAITANWQSGLLLHTRMKICRWHEWRGSIESLLEQLEVGARVSEPFQLLGIPASRSLQRECAEIYCHAEYAIAPVEKDLFRKLIGKPRIRLAYLSSDYYRHATSYLMAELFELHDRSRFEVIGVCYGRSPQDEMRERVAKSFDRFVEVADKSDREIAEMLRAMEIDIAIDLKGHTQGNRLGILAERAAPIQVHYLGYPGTLGGSFIDYLVADATLIPVEHQTCYTEKIVYLPDSYQVNDRTRQAAVVDDLRRDHGLPETGFVYCCFNNNWKITPDLFDVWMRLLMRVEGSVLWLFEDNDEASTNLKTEALRRGVQPDRLIFAKKQSPDQHLARHRHADLFLDTLYCNAHTTASDALWMGLPIITCLGKTFASRVGASLLRSMEVPELVVGSIESYEALAIDLATNPDKLAKLKQKLIDHRLAAPLFNTPQFTKHLESGYEAIWARYQSGLAPDHIHL